MTFPIGVACIPPAALNDVIAVIDPLLVNAPPVMLPVADTRPVVCILPPVTLPVADIDPPALILPPTPRPPPNTIAPVLVSVEFVELLKPTILLP